MKKFRKALSILLAAVILITSGEHSAHAQTVIGREDHQIVDAPGYVRPAAPEINSDTAIMIELNSGVMLYSKNIHQRMYPASITKIITALIAIEELDLDDKLVLSWNSVNDLVEGGEDGRRRFYEGQSFTVEDAIYGLCLNSVNTIGYALAEKIDGDLLTFADRMNERARELGAINTTFHNPHGLNDLLHMTTAYDMAMIMWGAIQNDTYRKIAGTRSYSFTDDDGHEIVCDHNYLVFQPTSDYYDERVVAGKTGWVEEAEYTRTLYATDGNLDIICVTFHADTTHDAYMDVRRLLDYAFDNFSLVDLPEFGNGGEITSQVTDEKTGEEFTLRVKAGAGRSTTGASVLVPNSYADQEWDTELLPDGEGGLKAIASLGGVTLGTYPLTTSIVRETAPPATEAPEPTSETGQGGTTPASPTSPTSPTKVPSTTASRSSETDPAVKSGGGGWKTVAIVLLAILLVLSLLFSGVMAYQNRILKERIRRRKAIKKREP